MRGYITFDLTPRIWLPVIEGCVIDTGFGGALYMSENRISELNLPFVTSTSVRLANNSAIVANVFEVTVGWMSTNRRVTVIEGPAGCETLIGMELLIGCQIELDEVAHEVRIVQL